MAWLAVFFGPSLEETHLLLLPDTIEAAWAAIHPACLTPPTPPPNHHTTLSFLSLSPPTPVGLSLHQSPSSTPRPPTPPLSSACLDWDQLASLGASSIPHCRVLSVAHFFGCFILSAVHPWTLIHIFLAFLQPRNWLLMKQSMCPLYSFPFFPPLFFLINLCVCHLFFSTYPHPSFFFGSDCLQSPGVNEF